MKETNAKPVCGMARSSTGAIRREILLLVGLVGGGVLILAALFLNHCIITDPFALSRPKITLKVPLTVDLQWIDNTGGGTSFQIERRVGEDGEWKPLGTAPAGTHSFKDTDIAGGEKYAYRVSFLQDPATPRCSKVASITSPRDSDKDGIPDHREAAYKTSAKLYSSGNNGAPDGWWVLHGLDPYSSSTQDTDGDVRSDSKEFVDETDPRVRDEAPPTPEVAAPSDLVKQVNPDGSSDLTWNDNSNNEKIYIIQRKLPDGTWEDIATVPANTTSFHLPPPPQKKAQSEPVSH